MDPSDELVVAWLGARRRQVIGALDGLTDEQAHAVQVPSGWSLVGLVQHLALDVERFWFRAVMAGEQVELVPHNDAWQVPADVPVDDVVAAYEAETAAADAVIASMSLDAAPAWFPGGDCPYPNLREILFHVLSETSIHAGHADVARELIDGRQRLVMGE